MTHAVQLFAAARELAGIATLRVDLPADATVGVLRERLATLVPGLARQLPHCRIAVDLDFASDDHVLKAESEIAVIPPVSGGQA